MNEWITALLIAVGAGCQWRLPAALASRAVHSFGQTPPGFAALFLVVVGQPWYWLRHAINGCVILYASVLFFSLLLCVSLQFGSFYFFVGRSFTAALYGPWGMRLNNGDGKVSVLLFVIFSLVFRFVLCSHLVYIDAFFREDANLIVWYDGKVYDLAR